MVIIRSVKPYHYVYKIFEDLRIVSSPDTLKSYDEIDWTRVASHSILLKMDALIQDLGREEYVYIIDQKSDKLSNERLNDLRLLFWTLAKIQSDLEIMDEIKN
jgi:hypothetical protein